MQIKKKTEGIMVKLKGSLGTQSLKTRKKTERKDRKTRGTVLRATFEEKEETGGGYHI